MNFYCEPYACKMTRRACGARYLVVKARLDGKRISGDGTGGGTSLDSVRRCIGCAEGPKNEKYAKLTKNPNDRPRDAKSNLSKVRAMLAEFGGQVTYLKLKEVAAERGLCVRKSLSELKKRGEARNPSLGVWEAVEK